MNNDQLSDAEFWNGYATVRAAIPEFLHQFAHRAIEQARLPAESSVLDVATGTGAVVLAAVGAGHRVLATDFSQVMIDQVASYGVDGIEVAVMDGRALDLRDGSVDAAFSNFGVSLFDDWQAGLSEMARVIRPEGIGSVATWQDPGGAAATLLLAQLCRELVPDLDQPPPSGGQDILRHRDGLRSALEAAGFIDAQIISEAHDAYVDADAVREPDRLFVFSPLWPELGAGQRDQVLEAIDERLRSAGGRIAVPSPALVATARRPSASSARR